MVHVASDTPSSIPSRWTATARRRIPFLISLVAAVAFASGTRAAPVGAELPDPIITNSTPGYDATYGPLNLFDNDPNTEYAVNNVADPFVEFDFGAPTNIGGFYHQDRFFTSSPAQVETSELIFSNNADFSDPITTISVTHPGTSLGETEVYFILPAPARYVRWHVTSIVGGAYAGGAEMAFLAPPPWVLTPTDVQKRKAWLGGAAPSPVVYTITNNQSEIHTFSIAEVDVYGSPQDYAWLSLSAAQKSVSAGGAETVSASFDVTALAAGTYTAYVKFTDDATPTPKDVICQIDLDLRNLGPAGVIVADDFNDNVLDTSIWGTQTWNSIGPYVTEQNERAEFYERGYLVSTQSDINPVSYTGGGVKITGTWTAGAHPWTAMSIATRTDAIAGGTWRLQQNGVAGSIEKAGESTYLRIMVTENGVRTSEQLEVIDLLIEEGSVWQLELDDTGAEVTFRVTQVATAETREVTLLTEYVGGLNYVAFYNEMANGFAEQIPATSLLDDVRVEGMMLDGPQVIVEDDFNDNSLDSSKWEVRGGTVKPCWIAEQNQQLEMQERPYLVTQRSDLDPKTFPLGLKIGALWTAGPNPWTAISIATRTDAQPSGYWRLQQNGLAASLEKSEGEGNILRLVVIESGVRTAQVRMNGTGLVIDPGTRWRLELIDDGDQATFTATNVDDPTQTNSVALATSYSGLLNHVAFYNEMDGGAYLEPTLSSLDDVRIEGLATTCSSPAQDSDGDADVDLADFGVFQSCFNGPNRPYAPGVEPTRCSCFDADEDLDVDLADFGVFQGCFNGPNRPPACS